MTQPLPQWAAKLLNSLEIPAVTVDIETLSTIAESLNDDPDRDRLLVGFIAGYAAGLAEGGSMANFDRAHTASLRFMRKHLTRE